MFYGTFTDARIIANPKFKIVGKNITLESKLMDSGTRGTLYATHPLMIIFFIRFCGLNSKHVLKGPTNATAFSFNDSTRAFVSVRMTVDDIKPLPIITEDGEVIPTTAKRLVLKDIDPGQNKPMKKLKYVLMKYVFENIRNEEMVPSRFLNIDTFAMGLYDLHEELVTSGICVRGNYNPVVISDRITRPQTSAAGRPVPRGMVTTYEFNVNVRITDWSLSSMSMEKLIDDTTPFDASIFVSPTMED